MIAEDDNGIIEAMQIMLEDAGYTVLTTVNGKTVHDIQKEMPDVLLLDIWMSGMNGTEICKKLKSKNLTKHIPVIIVSANKDTQKIAMECGADDFLEKPFEMQDLLTKVKRFTS